MIYSVFCSILLYYIFPYRYIILYVRYIHLIQLTRCLHSQVGTKKASEDNDETAEDDLHDPTTTTTTNNTKTAFIRAKTKILQKLSTQHLVSHTLPVVISLKHCLETTKSSLQGALMEFLISLIKYHKNEVEEVIIT